MIVLIEEGVDMSNLHSAVMLFYNDELREHMYHTDHNDFRNW